MTYRAAQFLFIDMRLVKDRNSSSSELIEISEYDYQLEIMRNFSNKSTFRYTQYCDVPNPKEIKGRILRLIQWNNKSLCKSLVAKPRVRLRRAVQELKALNEKEDNKKYFVYTKHKLIKLLFEEAYEAGLLRLQGPKAKIQKAKTEKPEPKNDNGNSKADKQESSDSSSPRKSVKRGRKSKSDQKD